MVAQVAGENRAAGCVLGCFWWPVASLGTHAHPGKASGPKVPQPQANLHRGVGVGVGGWA